MYEHSSHAVLFFFFFTLPNSHAGPKGPKGHPGKDGRDGDDGVDGQDGADGARCSSAPLLMPLISPTLHRGLVGLAQGVCSQR